MHSAQGQRLFIHRQDLRQTQIGADPDATLPLQDGEARLAIDHFALTANNITYAAFGKAMKYWQFFPAPDAAWGCLPVWGFAQVVESRASGIEVGRRIYGYLPAGTHLVVQVARLSPRGFADAAAHRQELAAVYNQYSFCDADPAWSSAGEGLQAVLKPLFTTAFLLDDFLADNQFFGARRLLLSSASSKTAFGTAFCLARRRGSPGHPSVVGLTAAANRSFTQALGCYDQVCPYDEVAQLDPMVPTVYVDFSGSASVRSAVHTHLGSQLMFSSAIGGTHWTDLSAGGTLPGPRPTLFFAPEQVKKRAAPPPQGWGRDGLELQLGQAWEAFIAQVQTATPPWVQVVHRQGASATEAAYRALLEGKSNAQEGLMLGLQG
jgi:hypothetical protein